MSTTIAAQGAGRVVPRLRVTPGTTLELLVLVADGGECAGIDLVSGALVRAWSPGLCVDLDPYDVAEVTVAADPDSIPDPSQPEAVPCLGPPDLTGRITGRRAERLLRPLLHPAGQPLLGLPSDAVAFWERRADHPSMGLVEPQGPIHLRREGPYLACRFYWQGAWRELACLDRRAAGSMDRSGRLRQVGAKGARLVVALTPPIEGRCHKVVEAVLPRP